MGLEERRPPWLDPAVPAREDCVLKAMLDTRAARHPERVTALVLADTRAEDDTPDAREGRHASAPAWQRAHNVRGSSCTAPQAVQAW